MRKISKDSKVAVAISGGVDSGVAAALLVEQGYKVVGLFMEHLDGVESQEEVALQVAGHLNIPLEIVDLRKEFEEGIIGYFLNEHRVGRTPNPCVVCNKWIKFGKLLEYARGLGCNYFATGHYAREKQLEHILFPIGGLTKDRVKEIAREKNLPVAERSESFEICFISDSIGDFLRRQIPEAIKPGPVINTKSEVIGRHRGLPLYTYGQRRGFELSRYTGIPLYVVDIDKDRNALIVGRGKDSEVSRFKVEGVNWSSGSSKYQIRNIKYEIRCQVRIRHQGELMPATVELLGDDKAQVVLDEPTCAITPGQSAVFYRGEELLGGGAISDFT